MKYFWKKIPKIGFCTTHNYFYPPNKFLCFGYCSLLWKNKYNTPRMEECPYIGIFIGNKFYSIQFGTDEWWEQRIWWKYYCYNNYKKAKDTWPRISHPDKKSTWKI